MQEGTRTAIKQRKVKRARDGKGGETRVLKMLDAPSRSQNLVHNALSQAPGSMPRNFRGWMRGGWLHARRVRSAVR